MSLYQFLASDKKLESYDNQRIVLDRKNKILKGKEGKQRIFDIDEQSAMRIYQEEDRKYVDLYTDKKYAAYIEWCYNEENVPILMEYIKQHLESARRIELWNVWLGPKEEVKKSACSIEELSIQNIKNIWGKEEFIYPECLTVYRMR